MKKVNGFHVLIILVLFVSVVYFASQPKYVFDDMSLSVAKAFSSKYGGIGHVYSNGEKELAEDICEASIVFDLKHRNSGHTSTKNAESWFLFLIDSLEEDFDIELATKYGGSFGKYNIGKKDFTKTFIREYNFLVDDLNCNYVPDWREERFPSYEEWLRHTMRNLAENWEEEREKARECLWERMTGEGEITADYYSKEARELADHLLDWDNGVELNKGFKKDDLVESINNIRFSFHHEDGEMPIRDRDDWKFYLKETLNNDFSDKGKKKYTLDEKKYKVSFEEFYDNLLKEKGN